MRNIILSSIISISFLLLSSPSYPLALTPNPIISQGKQVYGSGINGAANLTNGKFGESAWILYIKRWAAGSAGGAPAVQPALFPFQQ
jgi:hypothetical protein